MRSSEVLALALDFSPPSRHGHTRIHRRLSRLPRLFRKSHALAACKILGIASKATKRGPARSSPSAEARPHSSSLGHLCFVAGLPHFGHGSTAAPAPAARAARGKAGAGAGPGAGPPRAPPLRAGGPPTSQHVVKGLRRGACRRSGGRHRAPAREERAGPQGAPPAPGAPVAVRPRDHGPIGCRQDLDHGGDRAAPARALPRRRGLPRPELCARPARRRAVERHAQLGRAVSAALVSRQPHGGRDACHGADAAGPRRRPGCHHRADSARLRAGG